eukprot:9482403-Pyramimonas_sp.AAC.1
MPRHGFWLQVSGWLSCRKPWAKPFWRKLGRLAPKQPCRSALRWRQQIGQSQGPPVKKLALPLVIIFLAWLRSDS